MLESVARGITDMLRQKVYRNLQHAMNALEKLKMYQESSGGPYTGVARFRHRLRTSRFGLTAKMTSSKSIPDAWSEVELSLVNSLKEVSTVTVHQLNIENHQASIEIHRKLDETMCQTQFKEEQFVRHFDYSELPDDVVLDFS